MRKYIEQYLGNCCTCRQVKALGHSPSGFLKHLPVPQRPWQAQSIDFVTGLPLCEGLNAILVVLDHLTKMCQLIPCRETAGAHDVARMYMDHVWKLHGLPSDIASDQGPQFTTSL